MADKNQLIPADLKLELFEYAHDHRTSMSAVIAAAVDAIADGRAVKPPVKTKREMVEVKYTAPPRYAIAKERARKEGVALSTWIALEVENTVRAGR